MRHDSGMGLDLPAIASRCPKTGVTRVNLPFSLQATSALSIETAMNTRRVLPVSSSAASATATVRALSSTLLLLGLTGDRRAR